MRLRDLFVDYYRGQDIHIVNIPNTQIYYAIRSDGCIAASTVIHKLSEAQVQAIIRGELSAQTIYNDSNWLRLDSYEDTFPPLLLARIAKAAEKM